MVNKTIKILDCTLRDGGYVNNWNFGYDNIKKIIKNLDDSGIDFIECGFMTDKTYNQDKTLFASAKDIQKILPDGVNKEKIVAMIDYGEYSTEKIEPANENSIGGYRIIFKKNNLHDALNLCREIKLKGYKVFINPTFINQYSEAEFSKLTDEVNGINPYAFSIVDSMGVMRNADAKNLFCLADYKLNDEITLCFHSHNNLQLSFSNAKELIESSSKRPVIIDASVFGMGRGAGNIKTEFLIQYLNENHNKNYKILPVLKTIQNYINRIFEQKPWGYSVPYYLAAQSLCHPNYATFLIEKHIPLDDIDRILNKIPEENKICFDKNLIESIYKQTFEVLIC